MRSRRSEFVMQDRYAHADHLALELLIELRPCLTISFADPPEQLRHRHSIHTHEPRKTSRSLGER